MFDVKKQKRNLIRWYNKIAEKYDYWGGKKQQFISENYDEEMRSINTLMQLKKGDKLLDVATGTGNYLILAANKGAICYGIDITPKIIEVTKDKIMKSGIKGVKEIRIGDAQDIPHPNAFFDWVVCIGMLEYYPLDIAKTILKEFKRVLKKGGKVILDFPNSKNQESYEFKKKSEEVDTNVFICERNLITQAIKEAGFNIICTKEAGFEIQFLLQSK